MNAENSAPLNAGIDIGTQSVRVVVVEESGRIVSSGDAPLKSAKSDAGKHEQDPESWWKAVGEACRQAVSAVPNGDIGNLALCSTSGTILLTDFVGESLTPALMYNDGRAEEEARRVQKAGEQLWSSLGYKMRSSFALPKLLWLMSSGVADGSTRMLHSADFVASRLAVEVVYTDWSHALKTGYDLVNDRWPTEILEDLEIPVELLPPVVRPGSMIGEVQREASEHTGLPVGTEIRAGMTDGCAAQIAAGALGDGQWNSVLGTTLVLKGVTQELLQDPNGVIYSHRHPDGGWLPGGASNVGAGMLSEEFGNQDLKKLNDAAERYGPATTVAYPLTTEGERFPFANPEARSFVLEEPDSKIDRYRALLEGVAFVERLCFSYLESLGAEVSGPISLTGGGSKSRFWCQLRADILGLPVTVPRSAEPAVGMAILASAGESSVSEAAARMTDSLVQLESDEKIAEGMARNFNRFLDELAGRDYISTELAQHARMS